MFRKMLCTIYKRVKGSFFFGLLLKNILIAVGMMMLSSNLRMMNGQKEMIESWMWRWIQSGRSETGGSEMRIIVSIGTFTT